VHDEERKGREKLGATPPCVPLHAMRGDSDSIASIDSPKLKSRSIASMASASGMGGGGTGAGAVAIATGDVEPTECATEGAATAECVLAGEVAAATAADAGRPQVAGALAPVKYPPARAFTTCWKHEVRESPLHISEGKGRGGKAKGEKGWFKNSAKRAHRKQQRGRHQRTQGVHGEGASPSTRSTGACRRRHGQSS